MFCCGTVDGLFSWVALCLAVAAGGFGFLGFCGLNRLLVVSWFVGFGLRFVVCS